MESKKIFESEKIHSILWDSKIEAHNVSLDVTRQD